MEDIISSEVTATQLAYFKIRDYFQRERKKDILNNIVFSSSIFKSVMSSLPEFPLAGPHLQCSNMQRTRQARRDRKSNSSVGKKSRNKQPRHRHS